MGRLKTLVVMTALAAAFAAYSAEPAFAGETQKKTVFCKVEETSCKAENQDLTGLGIKIKLKPGAKAKIKAGFAVIECSESELTGTMEWNEENHTPHGLAVIWKLLSCNAGQEVTVVEKPIISIHHEVEAGHPDTGVLTLLFGIIKVKVGGTECSYGGTVAGSGLMINGGAPATVNAETKLEKVGGGILCASPAEFLGEYESTEPSSFHISTTP